LPKNPATAKEEESTMLRSAWRPSLAALVLLAVVPAAFPDLSGHRASAQRNDPKFLHIGTSSTLTSTTDASREKGALESLKDFIKSETGLDNDIVRQKDWREVADKMSKGQLNIGVFQGFEFAWAQEKYPGLKPLALAVDVYPYPVAYVVTRKDGKAADFAGLKGQSVCLPGTGQRYLRLFLDRQAAAAGAGKAEDFFAKITSRDNVEDAIDDVVDGTVQATVVDRAGLEAFKRRKPARFAQLKPIAQSQPLPPVTVAYHDNNLSEETVNRFRDGLLKANQSDRGQTILTTFRLTGFVAPPNDFAQVLAEARKTFPEAGGTK
jgi:ABC-type phosphate/phosphonate transport system substrate-binding protein